MDNHFQTPRDTVPTESTSPQPQQEPFFGELVRFAIIALIIVFPIRLFIAQPFIVSGASMEPTFENGEYLIVDQLTYRLEEPERGDIVIFKAPPDPSSYFIKRVIGLPGETITITNDGVSIVSSEHPVGITLNEPYLANLPHIDAPLTEELGADEYFVMGDNRDKSSDSRVWGVLTRDHIVGRAFLRLLPLGALDVFPGSSVVPSDYPR